jgi:hypothetical protein
MYCDNCGAENSDSDNFCRQCGNKLEHPQNKNYKTVIGLLIIIIVLLIIIAAFASGIMTPQDEQVKLESYDFGYLTMDVPKGSEFNEYDNVGKGTTYWAIGYSNSNEDHELIMVWISNYDSSPGYDFIEKEGNLDIFKGPFNNSYMIQRHVDGYYIQVSGLNGLDILKEIANSIEVEKPLTEEF